MRLVSAVLPFHNETNVIKTIESLIKQNYLLFEIIVVDDGSYNDIYNKIIENYYLVPTTSFINITIRCKQIHRVYEGICNGTKIKLVVKENGGKADALNVGICLSKAKYVLCLDSDSIVTKNTIKLLSNEIKQNEKVVAVGGKVVPRGVIINFVSKNSFYLKDLLNIYQELEYNLAFNIIRPIFDKYNTTMLISGALGLFDRELIIKLGGYKTNTVGEDMELVMRIRKHISDNNLDLKIAYIKEAICYTEVPWNVSDLIRQRMRWTVGLSEVLFKYKEVLYKTNYRLKEKIAFLYYLLFEKYSPHIEFITFSICLFKGIGEYLLIVLLIRLLFQIAITIFGSYRTIKSSIVLADNKVLAIITLPILLISYVSIYHIIHSFVRLISLPYYRIKNRNSNKENVTWVSPKRQ